jgi:predicted dehydrogenase
MKKLEVFQWGTKHGHSKGWLDLIIKSKNINFNGLYEPDLKRKNLLLNSKDKIWNNITWIDKIDEVLKNKNIDIVFIEESNEKSLEALEICINNNKHVMLDKPAGNNYKKFESIVKKAKQKKLIIELGYMFRQHDGFKKISQWSKSGILGEIFMIRAHMSTNIPEKNSQNENISRTGLSKFKGGIFYDLAGHMIDQICWIQGRPKKIKSFFKNSATKNIEFSDNTISVFEYDKSMAIIDISALEISPLARRFEIYGTQGSVIMEPFEPAKNIHLSINKNFENFNKGLNIIKIKDLPRYKKSLDLFLKRIRNKSISKYDLDHELLVQETLMRSLEE